MTGAALSLSCKAIKRGNSSLSLILRIIFGNANSSPSTAWNRDRSTYDGTEALPLRKAVPALRKFVSKWLRNLGTRVVRKAAARARAASFWFS